jgi:plasmid maintenance system antidote protein VapI
VPVVEAPKLTTLTELARLLHVTPARVSQLLADGAIAKPRFRLGRAYGFAPDEVAQALRSRGVIE